MSLCHLSIFVTSAIIFISVASVPFSYICHTYILLQYWKLYVNHLYLNKSLSLQLLGFVLLLPSKSDDLHCSFVSMILSSDVSISHFYPCHFVINLISHHIYPTSFTLVLFLLPCVSIPHLYPCHLLINLICHHMCPSHLFHPCHLLINTFVCLSHISTLVTCL